MFVLLPLLACTARLAPVGPRDTWPGDDTAPVDSADTVDTGDPPDTVDSADTVDTVDTDVVPSGTPLPAPDVLPLSAITDLGDAIDDLFQGETHGAYIVDLDNGEVVYASNPDRALKPASNTKLYTTAAAMGLWGEDHRFLTRVYGSTRPDGAGEVADLTALVGHDATWSAYVYADEFFPADRLADQLHDLGLRSVSGAVVFSGEAMVGGSSVGTYDAASHRADGVAVLEDALVARGIAVGGTGTSADLDPPAGQLLVERESPPLHVVATPLNRYSHNEMADCLARHNGWELDGDSSYPAGEDAVFAFLDGEAVDTRPLVFMDGSGLSHDNRITARITVELIQAMDARPEGQAWLRSLAIAGVVGTVDYRMTGPDTLGRVFAKTGSLYDTIALSGVLYHAYDGHRYAFSLLLNDVTDQTAARELLDSVVEELAADHRRRGERPAAPVLRALVAGEDGGLVASWTPSARADGYALWTSDDGRVWDRADATFEAGPTAVLAGSTSRPTYVRVAALNEQGRSEYSDVLAATAGTARVLIVDGEDRWDVQSENTLGEGHDFVRSVAEVVGEPLESVANEAVIDGTVDLADYEAVIWLLGEESTDHDTFDADERDLVADYLDGGGNLLVSGAEIGWDLDAMGDAGTAAFYEDVLHASYVSDAAETLSATPSPGGMFDGVGELGFYTPARLQVWYPDRIAPAAGAEAVLSYAGGLGGTAAVAYDGDHRVVHLAFPVESIDAIEQREAIVRRSLAFFGM